MKFNPNQLDRVENAIKNGAELRQSFKEDGILNITMWLDLLGFQKQLSGDLDVALNRISVFHEISLTFVQSYYHIAQLNDATVVSIDLPDDLPKNTPKDPPSDLNVLTKFIGNCDTLFETATYADKKIGGYGVRGVIALGFRQNLRGNFGTTSHSNQILDIRFSSSVPIMMNMAFASAYQLESSGLLIKEPSLYIDKKIFGYNMLAGPDWKNNGEVNFQGSDYMMVRRFNE